MGNELSFCCSGCCENVDKNTLIISNNPIQQIPKISNVNEKNFNEKFDVNSPPEGGFDGMGEFEEIENPHMTQANTFQNTERNNNFTNRDNNNGIKEEKKNENISNNANSILTINEEVNNSLNMNINESSENSDNLQPNKSNKKNDYMQKEGIESKGSHQEDILNKNIFEFDENEDKNDENNSNENNGQININENNKELNNFNSNSNIIASSGSYNNYFNAQKSANHVIY